MTIMQLVNHFRKKKRLISSQDDRQWQLDFLPEYQAILKKPPASIGRFLGVGIAFLFFLIILWSSLFSMDIVATAEGKLSAVQGSKIIQAATFGEIVTIAINNGDKVNAGDLLIKLDDTEQQARASMLQGMIAEAKIDIARYEALQTSAPEANFVPPEGLNEAQIAEARDRLRTSLYYYQVQIEGLKQQPGKENEPKLLSTEMRVKSFKSEYQEKLYSRLSQVSNRLLELEANLVKTQEEIKAMTILSPVSGQVQELFFNTLGAVVEPAQKLMVIVPDDIELKADVMILSKDIGFIHLQQPVEVKVDSFPYTRFGTIEGGIEAIAKDAVLDEDQGLLYPAVVSLQKQAIAMKEGLRPLRPGMHVVAEIKTGRRRIISYLLSPLQEYQSESMKER